MIDSHVFGLSPSNTMSVEKQRKDLGFQKQPQKVILFGFSKNQTEQLFARILNVKEAEKIYGKDSILHQMVLTAFVNYPSIELYGYNMGIEAEGIENKPQVNVSIIPKEQFTQFVLPFYDQPIMELLVTELDKRWKDEHIDGHLILADSSNIDQLMLRYVNDKDTLANTMHVSVLDTIESETPTWGWAAALGAVNACYATTPSRPLTQIELLDVLPAKKDGLASRDRLTRNQLLSNGISTLKISGGRAYLDRVVTTYKRDGQTGTPDNSYSSLNAKQTLSAIRYDWLTYVNQMFHRYILSQDESQAGEFVATPKSMLGMAISRHEVWKRELLAQDPGDEFAKKVKIEVADDGEHFLASLPVHLVGQFYGTHTVLAFNKGKKL